MSKKPKVSARKRPQQKRSESLVESIKMAATRVLNLAPYDKATTTKIAEIAGVSIGSLYQYFPGKDAIIRLLIKDRTEEQLQNLETILSSSVNEPLESVLEKLIRMIAEPAYESRGLSRLFHEVGLILGAGDEVISTRHRASELIFDDFKRRPDVARLPNLRSAILILMNAVLGAIAVATISPARDVELDELVDELVEMSVRYLKR